MAIRHWSWGVVAFSFIGVIIVLSSGLMFQWYVLAFIFTLPWLVIIAEIIGNSVDVRRQEPKRIPGQERAGRTPTYSERIEGDWQRMRHDLMNHIHGFPAPAAINASTFRQSHFPTVPTCRHCGSIEPLIHDTCTNCGIPKEV